jgi:hypothetical protein
VIDAELNWENYCSISATTIENEKRLKSLYIRTDPELKKKLLIKYDIKPR